MGDKSKDKLTNISVALLGFEYVEQLPLGFFEFDDEKEKKAFLI